MLYNILAALIGGLISLAAYLIINRIVLKGRKEEIIEKAEA